PDETHLLVDALDQAGAVARADEELLHARSEQPALDAKGRPALVALGVNDVNPRGPDGDVVDVRPCPGDAAVVEEADTLLREIGQPRAQQLLSACAAGPGGRALRLVGKREDEATKPRVRFADPSLALRGPTFVLASRGGARCPCLDGIQGGRRHRLQRWRSFR